jgi:hypothetical protein
MARWDMLLAIAAVAGGTMLIEDSHRVDTGAPDDEVTASAPADCTVVYAINRERMSEADEGALREKAAAALPSNCADR